VAGKRIQPQREARIEDEIIVDAHTDEERAMSWYYYLDSELCFPFEAECVKQWPISPLRKGEKIQITALAPAEHCAHQIMVLGQWSGRSLGVSLTQLKPTIADWHYWAAHENQF
jgi:hypothetical protein